MTYEQALSKIHSLLTFGSRPGLERMKIFLDRIGNPQDNLKFVHVAGTNGKGSVCQMLSSVLVDAGYKTGLFVSPYITDFRERIQINNVMISEDELVSAVEQTFPVLESLSDEGIIITEFEYVNALEFFIHSKQNCDIVVLETGMGGLLDCTNVIKPPLCSVITTIGLDHTAVLGNTIEKIAQQKCGIFKENSIAITSAQVPNAMQIIESTAREKHIPLAKSLGIEISIKSSNLNGSQFTFGGKEIFLPLAGKHQIENAKTALAAIEILRLNDLISVSDENIINGFAKVKNPARLEVFSESPVILLDGAHNPNGIEALKNAVKQFIPNKKIIAIIGMLKDKDSESSLKLLEGVFDEILTVPVNNPRSLSSLALAKKCQRHFNDVSVFDNVKSAFDWAYKKANNQDNAIVICGSLYLASEIRPYLIENFKK